jgi:molybdopterin synthase catalytic subunit
MSRFIQLVDQAIDIDSVRSKIDDVDVGAHGWFYGVTRRTTKNDSEQQVTQRLSYEAHRPMAQRELEALAERAAESFDLAHVVIVHRLGDVPIGQASVVVGCSSAHRKAVFAALSWIMETLKRDVPIWKRETYADGSRQWVHPIDDQSERQSE